MRPRPRSSSCVRRTRRCRFRCSCISSSTRTPHSRPYRRCSSRSLSHSWSWRCASSAVPSSRDLSLGAEVRVGLTTPQRRTVAATLDQPASKPLAPARIKLREIREVSVKRTALEGGGRRKSLRVAPHWRPTLRSREPEPIASIKSNAMTAIRGIATASRQHVVVPCLASPADSTREDDVWKRRAAQLCDSTTETERLASGSCVGSGSGGGSSHDPLRQPRERAYRGDRSREPPRDSDRNAFPVGSRDFLLSGRGRHQLPAAWAG